MAKNLILAIFFGFKLNSNLKWQKKPILFPRQPKFSYVIPFVYIHHKLYYNDDLLLFVLVVMLTSQDIGNKLLLKVPNKSMFRIPSFSYFRNPKFKTFSWETITRVLPRSLKAVDFTILSVGLE